MKITEVGRGGMDWMHLAQGRGRIRVGKGGFL